MAYWLLKSEPDVYSFDDLVRDKRTEWDGVKNNQALIHLRNMKKGDEALIYHTGKERQAIGLATVVEAAYPDPAEENERFVQVDVRVGKRLAHPVTLSAIKADGGFEGFDLLRISRLSVVPVSAAHWKRLLKMAERPS